MSGKWEKTFEIAVPVERVWEAFTNREELNVLLGPPSGETTPHEPGEGMEILELVPLKKIRWSQSRADLPEKCEFTITFESQETGTAMTVTRFGFGEGEDADIFSVSNGLGWEHGFRDMVLYLETGHNVKRHWDGCSLSTLGLAYIETDGGIQVCQVGEKGVGADAGLQRGDRIVRLANVPIYTRSDVWVLNSVHPVGTEIDVEFIRGNELLQARGRTIPVTERLVGE